MSRLRVASVLLAVSEVAVAGYLTWAHGRGGSPVCLAGGGGCQTVADSSYAELAGAPVAALGLAGAIVMVALALAPGLVARTAAASAAIGGALFSAYLTVIELFVIDAICQWCVASAILWGAMCLVECWRLRVALHSASADTP